MDQNKPKNGQTQRNTRRVRHLEFLELLGKGGMANVYKAMDHKRKKEVAVKVLNSEQCVSDSIIERFLREAKNLIELSHPNIVKGYETGRAEDYVFFTMEYIEGRDLSQLIDERGPLPVKQVIEIARQVSKALSYAYERGKIHRDIKPANLMLTSEGVIKLTDLGLVKSETDPALTAATVVIGTPYYMSPERVSGSSEIDIRSDIYSLGATLAHLLTGFPPFAGEEDSVVMTKQITDEFPIPWKALGLSGHRFRYILTKMVSKRPQMRYQTPDELLADLESLDDKSEASTKEKELLEKVAADQNRLYMTGQRPIVGPELRTVLTDKQIRSISGYENLNEYKPGDVLFYEQSRGRDFYILISGKCEVLQSGKRLAVIEDPGSCFGEIAAIVGVKRTATIRATEKTVCVKIPHNKLQVFLLDHPDVQISLLQIALKRLTDTNEKYVKAQAVIANAQAQVLRIIRSAEYLSLVEVVEQLRQLQEEIQKSTT